MVALALHVICFVSSLLLFGLFTGFRLTDNSEFYRFKANMAV